jgi:hypothetical protein
LQHLMLAKDLLALAAAAAAAAEAAQMGVA